MPRPRTHDDEIIELRAAGWTGPEIALMLDVNVDEVYRCMARSGLVGRHRPRPFHDETIIRLRDAGLTFREIARQVGISTSGVWHALRRNGAIGKYRGPGRPRKDGKPVRATKKRVKKSPFTLRIIGNSEIIHVLPTSKTQFTELLKILQDRGGEII